jgi:uncharacterized ParB-like nuclease family protein
VVHAAGNGAAANGEVEALFVIGGQETGHVLDRAVGGHHERGVVADRAGHQRQVAEALREHARVSERITMGVEFTISVLSRLSAFSIM